MGTEEPPEPWPFRFSRNPNHETRITDFTAARSLLSCAMWRGMGRLWRGMGGRRPSLRQHGLLGFHESRNTNHETRLLRFSSHDFPRFPGISRYFPAPPHPPVKGPRAVRIGNTAGRVFTRHESRITAFYCVLRPSDGETCRLVPALMPALRSPVIVFVGLWRGNIGDSTRQGAEAGSSQRRSYCLSVRPSYWRCSATLEGSGWKTPSLPMRLRIPTERSSTS